MTAIAPDKSAVTPDTDTMTSTAPLDEIEANAPRLARRAPVAKVAIVGAGYIAGYHIEALRQLRGVEVVGACDPDAARLADLCRRWSLPHGASSLEDLVRQCRPDAVHLLAPPPLHAELAEQALAAGLHVLVEKPMALAGEQCARLLDLARSQGLHLGVNHNSLFHPPYRRLLADVKAGKLGRIEHVISVNNLPLAQLQAGEHDHWMFRDPANVLFEQGPHPLAQICGLLGRVRRTETIGTQRRVLRTGVPFVANWQISLECEEGTAQLFLAFGKSFPAAALQVIGQDGAAHVDLIHDVYVLDRPTMRVPPLDSLLRRLAQARQLAGCGLANFVRYGRAMLRLGPRSDAYFQSMHASIASFHQALAQGQRDDASAGSGRMVIEGLERIAAAAPPRPAAAPPPAASAPRTGEVLVIGGTGFIGRRVVAALLAAGQPVRMLVRKPALLPEAARRGDVSVCVGDACNPADVDRAVQGCRAVMHLVAGAPADWAGFEKLFVVGTRLAAEACLAHHVEQLLFASSICALYLGKPGVTVTEETPIDPYPELRCDYARAKILCERLLMQLHRERKLGVTILRPGIVVGAGGPFAHLGVGTWPAPTHCVTWGRGRHGLPFVLVDDVAAAFVGALGKPEASGRAFNLVGDVRLSADEYVQAVRDELGRDVQLHRRSVLAWKALESLVWTVKAVGRKPNNHAMSYRELAYRTAVSPLDCTQTKCALDWTPVADREQFIELGIRQALSE